jgi:molecular chaperone HtpG
MENREKLQDLVMFKSTAVEGYTTLAEYKERMKTDQDAIYYITGAKEDNIRNSPLLEMYKNRDIEVLVMDDEIDDIVITMAGQYKDTPLKSVNRSDAAESLKTDEDKQKEKDVEPLIRKIKEALGDLVKDVKASTRLSDSPSCIVADENDPTIQMQHLFKAMGQKNVPDFKPILEINPGHEIIRKLENTDDAAVVSDISHLLLEQALLIEGVELKSPAEFVKRLNRVMGKSL